MDIQRLWMKDLRDAYRIIDSHSQPQRVLSILMEQLLAATISEIGCAWIRDTTGEKPHWDCIVEWGLNIQFKESETQFLEARFLEERIIFMTQLPAGFPGKNILMIPMKASGESVGLIILGNLQNPALVKNEFIQDALETWGGLAAASVEYQRLRDAERYHEQMEDEMKWARKIQVSLLPDKLPEIPGLQLATREMPSRQIGGDIYQAKNIGDNKFLLAVADITGKGIPGAMGTSIFQTILQLLVSPKIALSKLAKNLNSNICQKIKGESALTCFLSVYDAKTSTLTYCNAGHPPGLLWQKESQKVIELTQGGPLMGLLEEADYEEESISLKEEDLFLFYSDGVTEACPRTRPRNAEELFGQQRIEDILLSHASQGCDAVVDSLMEKLRQFSPEGQRDDIVMLCGQKMQRPVITL